MTKQLQPTPLEKLLAEKQQIKETCLKQEEKLNKTFIFIQANAGSLLLSGLSSLLFPAKSKEKKNATTLTETTHGFTGKSIVQIPDYLSFCKALLPIAWEVVQPLLVSFGIKLIKKRVTKLFSPSRNNRNDKKE